MINNNQTKYNVKYQDGTIQQIECEPIQIKKVLSQSINIPYENIVLINIQNNRMYSATNSFIQSQNNTINLNIMDINQILKENMNSKNKITELLSIENQLQSEIVQLKQLNRDIATQKNNISQENHNSNFQELHREAQQFKQNLNNQQEQYESKIILINKNKEDLQQENEDLSRRLQEQIKMTNKKERDFEKEKQSLAQESKKQINQLNSKCQNYEQQIAKLFEEIQYLKEKNEIIEQLQNEIEQQKISNKNEVQNLQTQFLQMEKQYQQQILSKLNAGINDISESLNLMNGKDVKDAIQELENIRKEMNNIEKNRNLKEQEKLKQQNDELQKKVEKLEQQVKQNKSQVKKAETDQHHQQQLFQIKIDDLNRVISQIKKDLEDKQEEINQQLLKNSQLQSENNQLNENNGKYEKNIKLLKDEKAKLHSNIEELEQKVRLQYNQLLYSEQIKKTQICENNKLKIDIEQLKQQLVKMNSKIKTLTQILKQISNEKVGLGMDKVQSPVELLLNSQYKVQKFMDNPNFQPDETDYLVYKIKPTNEFLESIKKGEFVNLKQYLNVEQIGLIQTLRSMQPNQEGDFMKIYITKVENTQIKELRNKFLIRKDLKNGQNYQNKNDTAALSLNNILTQVLMDQFVKDLTELSMRVLEFQIAPQYVIQEKGKELYYYCEEIIENNIKQINGGTRDLGTSQDEQFLNSFFKYSYILTNQELVITYINTVKQYMYDMIVTTEFCYFSGIDQGKDEYIRATDAIESANANNFGEFYNQKLEQKALSFIK